MGWGDSSLSFGEVRHMRALENAGRNSTRFVQMSRLRLIVASVSMTGAMAAFAGAFVALPLAVSPTISAPLPLVRFIFIVPFVGLMLFILASVICREGFPFESTGQSFRGALLRVAYVGFLVAVFGMARSYLGPAGVTDAGLLVVGATWGWMMGRAWHRFETSA